MPINAPFRPPRRIDSGDSPVVKRPAFSKSPQNLKVRKTVPKSLPPQRVSPPHTASLPKSVFTVQYRKKSNKKNKTWEGDGSVIVSGESATLKSENKVLARSQARSVSESGVFSMGSFEVEIDSVQSESTDLLESKPKTAPLRPRLPSRLSSQPRSSQTVLDQKEDDQKDQKEDQNLFLEEDSETEPEPKVQKPLKPQHTAQTPNQIQPAKPAEAQIETSGVKLDLELQEKLRPHQREGLQFILECTEGKKTPGFHGCLLADEMGLGKSLTAISVIWNLLRSKKIQKALICCPVTLIDNWRKEFGKWIDVNRIGILTLNNNKFSSAKKDKSDISSFLSTNVYQVLIMSYEKVLSCQNELCSDAPKKIDLLVCDEGHRLKKNTGKVLKVLNLLNVQRKLVMTGTPIQNDLVEFYNLSDFVNPGLLGHFSDFNRDFLKPILRARDVSCGSREIIKEGQEKSAQLIETTKKFMLRRTKSVLTDYLPKATHLLLFCPPSPLQKSLFQHVIKSSRFNSFLNSYTKDVLSLITVFRKICNSPSLVSEDDTYRKLCDRDIPQNRTSGKITVLVLLLLEFQKRNEKAVLVSNFTQTLDLLASVANKLNIHYTRLDGTVAGKDRDKLVTDFNRAPGFQVFLLSAKAGGTGLNLVGASRLVLFDNDWNPSIDLQAMARIHRDGQKKPVFIYRLFTTGCIDEKIFQRQLMKTNLSDMFLDEKTESALNIFDFEDLRDLFTVSETLCNTHDLLECPCSGDGERYEYEASEEEDSQEMDMLLSWVSALQLQKMDQKAIAKKQSIRSALTHYRHFDPEKLAECGDEVIKAVLKSDCLSYFFTS